MYSFLVLLPLTLITSALGALLIFSPQVADYVDYISSIEGHPDQARLPVQIIAHILAYAIMLFVLVAATRTISAPVGRDRPDWLCRTQAALEAIFVAVPSVIIVALATYSMFYGAKVAAVARPLLAAATPFAPPNILFWAAVAIATVALLTIVLSGRPQDGRSFGRALVAIVAGIPVTLFVMLLIATLAGAGIQSVSPLLTLTATVGAIGLTASVSAIALSQSPRELFQSTLQPFSITLTDAVAGLVVAVCLALIAAFLIQPLQSAAYLGMFPVLFIISAVALIVIAVIFAKGSSPVAIISSAISAIVVMHAFDRLMPTREFRYRSELPATLQAKPGMPVNGRDVEKERRIPELREAFLAWLQARRPVIEKYREKGKAYPVFVVAAQGGGIYAAYHSALTLARLYDACPALANHVFALSGVSGGALGSAVFAELLHGVPASERIDPTLEAPEGCAPRPGGPKLTEQVRRYFTADFLSPVIDSALLFDFPSLVVPWLRFGMDRAYALEYGFESAWRKISPESAATRAKAAPYGMEASFYGRWTPAGPAPALFLGTTGVNHGVPVLVSQIRWSQEPSLRWNPANGKTTTGSDVLLRAQVQSERARSSVIGNILDFRPDLQLATSTAVGLSARFPYVTPPANIERNPRIAPPQGLFEGINTLELLDGAYFDNSGGWVAIDMLDDLERYLQPPRWRNKQENPFKEFADDIKFRLIRFTDRPAQRYGSANSHEHFELVAPLIAFNSVRSARGAQLRGVRDLERTNETFVYLSDPWFLPSLNWLLSQDTKTKIELRSGAEGTPDAEVCCRVLRTRPAAATQSAAGVTARQASRWWSRREILLYAEWDEVKGLNDLAQQADDPLAPVLKVEKFTPNNKRELDKLLEYVRDGEERPSALDIK